jgi:hypothetical protein
VSSLLLGFLLAFSGSGQQQPSKEEIARGLYNQALLTPDSKESDKILDRIIVEFPTTVAATEAIKLRLQRVAARTAAEGERKRALEEGERRRAEAINEAKRRRAELLGGYEVSEITVHDLTVPIPNFSSTRREGENPQIIKLETSSGTAENLRMFYLTTLSEYKWKPMGRIGSQCWTQQTKTTTTERLCLDTDRYLGKATLYITTLKEDSSKQEKEK